MTQGFSADGYIIDQDCFSAYRYRTMSSDINGCGWIAAYNLQHALGQPADFDAVRAEMDAMFPLPAPGPTTMRVMRRYLDRHVPGYVLTVGRPAAAEEAARSRAGILRYSEQRVPHFVAYVRGGDGRCRFFNVADGLEDFTEEMRRFVAVRCARGCLRAFTVR